MATQSQVTFGPVGPTLVGIIRCFSEQIFPTKVGPTGMTQVADDHHPGSHLESLKILTRRTHFSKSPFDSSHAVALMELVGATLVAGSN